MAETNRDDAAAAEAFCWQQQAGRHRPRTTISRPCASRWPRCKRARPLANNPRRGPNRAHLTTIPGSRSAMRHPGGPDFPAWYQGHHRRRNGRESAFAAACDKRGLGIWERMQRRWRRIKATAHALLCSAVIPLSNFAREPSMSKASPRDGGGPPPPANHGRQGRVDPVRGEAEEQLVSAQDHATIIGALPGRAGYRCFGATCR